MTETNIALDLPASWQFINKKQAQVFTIELANELCDDHLLMGKTLECIAKKDARDDFLFIEPNKKQVYVVHLTWQKETSSNYPSFVTFVDRKDFFYNWKRIYE